MLENLGRNWTIEILAATADLSKPYLQKLFKTEAGMSPILYLRDLRLQRARELLENSFKRINEIGYEIGMRNDSHFTRDFKKKFGVTPTEYRKQYWGKVQAAEFNTENDSFRQEKAFLAKK